MGNIFGKIFRIATFGESHGPAIGCVIDGCRRGSRFPSPIFRRSSTAAAPGRARYPRSARSPDECKILSGVYEGKTLGTPICIVVENLDQRSGDYSEIAKVWRPSHADYTYDVKYGFRDPRGGGRSSGARNHSQGRGGGCRAQNSRLRRFGARVGRERPRDFHARRFRNPVA